MAINEPKTSDPIKKQEIVDKFTQLWQACYFERKLTKMKVEQLDLESIILNLMEYFADQTIDLKKTLPLLQGLHNLFIRQANYNLKDGQEVLDMMSNPIAKGLNGD